MQYPLPPTGPPFRHQEHQQQHSQLPPRPHQEQRLQYSTSSLPPYYFPPSAPLDNTAQPYPQTQYSQPPIPQKDVPYPSLVGKNYSPPEQLSPQVESFGPRTHQTIVRSHNDIAKSPRLCVQLDGRIPHIGGEPLVRDEFDSKSFGRFNEMKDYMRNSSNNNWSPITPTPSYPGPPIPHYSFDPPIPLTTPPSPSKWGRDPRPTALIGQARPNQKLEYTRLESNMKGIGSGSLTQSLKRSHSQPPRHTASTNYRQINNRARTKIKRTGRGGRLQCVYCRRSKQGQECEPDVVDSDARCSRCVLRKLPCSPRSYGKEKQGRLVPENRRALLEIAEDSRVPGESPAAPVITDSEATWGGVGTVATLSNIVQQPPPLLVSITNNVIETSLFSRDFVPLENLSLEPE